MAEKREQVKLRASDQIPHGGKATASRSLARQRERLLFGQAYTPQAAAIGAPDGLNASTRATASTNATASQFVPSSSSCSAARLRKTHAERSQASRSGQSLARASSRCARPCKTRSSSSVGGQPGDDQKRQALRSHGAEP